VDGVGYGRLRRGKAEHEQASEYRVLHAHLLQVWKTDKGNRYRLSYSFSPV
jgi:hypothetical protein